MTTLLAHAVVAAALSSVPGMSAPDGGAGRQPGSGALKPEPVTFSPSRVFDDLREAARSAPLAERLMVTVKHAEQSPVSAYIVLRIAPGSERDQHDSRVSIDAGPLRVYAAGGTKDAPGAITAVSTANAGTYYRVPLEGAPTLAAVSEALLPLPLPTLAVYFAPGGAPVADLTPLTRGITWEPTTLQPTENPFPPITLNGSMKEKSGQPVSLHLEYQQSRLRLRSFSAPLAGSGPQPKTISIAATSIDPGDPALWAIDVAGRTRVDTLAALGTKPEAPSPPTAPAATPPSATQPPAATPAKTESPSAEPAKPDPAPPKLR